ncbi:MAG: hypothetical protein DMD87_17990 [Candidatus Rokuibacteriota bacterium]|nr:MAG: hypothetical protein DMD87_17990 [Candidatus Rokubacteria bacterium]
MRWSWPALKMGGAVKSKRVLILDNDQAQIPRLKDCFAPFHHGCQYDVVAAALTQGRPDLIILEREMDGFDSFPIVSKLRQHDRTIPIIAASRGTKREATEAIFRLGLFAYVPKPVDFAPFEHIVAMACGST